VNAKPLLCCVLLACTPSSVTDAEKKGNVTWLQKDGSESAVAALGRLADEDKSAQAALESIAKSTEGGKTLPGGAAALDVYLAVWAGVERNEAWALGMMKKALGDPSRMDDAASAMKRGSAQIDAFVPDLDRALQNGCGHCAAPLASASGAAAKSAVDERLRDARTRDSMCAGLGSDKSSKDARTVFVSAAVSSRDAPSCANAAARMAARDDDVLSWVAKTAEPGLLRAAGESSAMPCDRLGRLWTQALAARDHASYGALGIPLGAAVKRCPKDLDPTLAGALGSDAESQTLAVMGVDPSDATRAKLPLVCAAVARVGRGAAPPPTKARAADIAAHCHS
jgi:hypothetical protein